MRAALPLVLALLSPAAALAQESAPAATPEPVSIPAPEPKQDEAPKAKPARDTIGPLRDQTRLFKEAAKCHVCGGDGEVEIKVDTPKTNHTPRTRGPTITTSPTVTKTMRCKECNGHKVGAEARVLPAGRRFVQALAAADTASAKWSDCEIYLKKALGETMDLGLYGIRSRVNRDAVKQWSTPDPKPGTPVLFVGVLRGEHLGGEGAIHRVEIGDTIVEIRGAHLEDANVGEWTFAGGLLVSGGDSPVLEHGFVLSPQGAAALEGMEPVDGGHDDSSDDEQKRRKRRGG